MVNNKYSATFAQQCIIKVKSRQEKDINVSRRRDCAGQSRTCAGVRATSGDRVFQRHWNDDSLFGTGQSNTSCRLGDGRRFAGLANNSYPWNADEWVHVFLAIWCRELSSWRPFGCLQMPGFQQRRQGARSWSHRKSW